MKKENEKCCPSFGSIPHLPESRESENHRLLPQNAAIFYKQGVLISEKLDGCCMGVLKRKGELLPIQRYGYTAATSHRKHHRLFDYWVNKNKEKFDFMENEDVVWGEWMAMAHGSLYALPKPEDTFVVFDYYKYDERLPNDRCSGRLDFGNKGLSVIKRVPIGSGDPVSFYNSINKVGGRKFVAEETSGHKEFVAAIDPLFLASKEFTIPVFGDYGCLEPVEGYVLRTDRMFNPLAAKYVRHTKKDGKYLGKDILNLGLDSDLYDAYSSI